jgi:ribosomal protein L29
MKTNKELSQSARAVFAHQLQEKIQRLYNHGRSGKNSELRQLRKTIARLKRKS